MDCLLYFIQVCNENNGFIMGLLTFVYVVATIFICIFNYKSAKEAGKQIELSNLIQKQNVDMHLFEMRKKLIFELKEELGIKFECFTKALEGNTYEENYKEKVVVLLKELPYLFQKEDFEFVYQANDYLNEIQKYLIQYNKIYSEYVYTFYKDGYKEKMKKFEDSTRDFFDNVIDDYNYWNISATVNAEDMCECMIAAKQKHLAASQLLRLNDIENVFKTKYLSFK